MKGKRKKQAGYERKRKDCGFEMASAFEVAFTSHTGSIGALLEALKLWKSGGYGGF
jgi:hypothetical protein